MTKISPACLLLLLTISISPAYATDPNELLNVADKDKPAKSSLTPEDIAYLNEALADSAGINTKNKDGHTALMRLTYDDGDNAELMQALIDAGADINTKDNDGETALMYAILHGNGNNMQILIDNGADINAKDNDGETALMDATDTETIKILLANGADIDAEDNDGRTALMRATEKPYPYYAKIAHLLLDNSSNIQGKDKYGNTPFMLAVYNDATFRYGESCAGDTPLRTEKNLVKRIKKYNDQQINNNKQTKNNKTNSEGK